MANLKWPTIMILSLSLSSCELLLGSYFPSDTDLLTSSVNYTDTIGNLEDGSFDMRMQHVSDFKGNGYFVIAVQGIDYFKMGAYHPTTMELVRKFPPTVPVMGTLGKLIGWDANYIYSGTSAYTWNDFSPIGVPISGALDESMVKTFNGVTQFTFRVLSSIIIYNINFYSSVSSFNSNVSGLTSFRVLSAFSNLNDVYLAITSDNNSEIWVYRIPVANLLIGVPILDPYKIFTLSLSKNDSNNVFLTNDGLIKREKIDGGDYYVRYDYSGNKLDSYRFYPKDNRVHFSQDGKMWYRIDPYTKKIYAMRTWWSQ